jgi:hypothetical protein
LQIESLEGRLMLSAAGPTPVTVNTSGFVITPDDNNNYYNGSVLISAADFKNAVGGAGFAVLKAEYDNAKSNWDGSQATTDEFPQVTFDANSAWLGFGMNIGDPSDPDPYGGVSFPVNPTDPDASDEWIALGIYMLGGLLNGQDVYLFGLGDQSDNLSQLQEGLISSITVDVPPSANSVITPTLSWLSDGSGGASVDYSVTGTLPSGSAPVIDLYWSPTGTYDPTTATATDDSVDVEQTHDGPTTFTAAELGTPPPGTKYLLAVADPDHLVTDPGSAPNVASIPYTRTAPALTVTGGDWDAVDGGAKFSYAVQWPGYTDGETLPSPVQMGVFWASGPYVSEEISDDLYQDSSDSVDHETPATAVVPASVLLDPPDGAKDLIFELDPDEQIDGVDRAKAFLAIPFDTTIAPVKATYNGSPETDVIGRYFAVPGVSKVKKETFDVILPPSLAAIRPVVIVQIGDGTTLETEPQNTLNVVSVQPDGVHYETTTTFDPGTLSGDTPLVASVVSAGDGESLGDRTETIDVEPVPDWLKSLPGGLSTSFTPDGDGSGSYTFSGLLQDLSSNLSLTTPSDFLMDWLSNQPISVGAGVGITVSAPLNYVKSPPVANPSFQIQAQLFSATPKTLLNVQGTGEDGELKYGVTFDTKPDAKTLELTGPNVGINFTIQGSFDTDLLSEELEAKLSKSDVIMVGEVPLVYELSVKPSMVLKVADALRLVYNPTATGPALAVDPTKTYLNMTAGINVTANANIGYFIPTHVGWRRAEKLIEWAEKKYHLKPEAKLYANLSGEGTFTASAGIAKGSTGRLTWLTGSGVFSVKSESGLKLSLNEKKTLYNPKFDLLKLLLPEGTKTSYKWKLVNDNGVATFADDDGGSSAD